MTDAALLRTTRTFYDAIAADYAERFRAELEAKPLGRAMLAAFAELVRAGGDSSAGPVADLGCGPGRVTAHLRSLGLEVFGIDLSPEMVALARREHPGVRFEVGSMTDLGLADGALAGVVAWYSVIHTPPGRLPAVFAEFHRLLAAGGHLLLAFQVGDEPLHLAQPFGHPVALDFNRLQPEGVAELLSRTGFVVQARLVREPDASEKVPQAYLLARKPSPSSPSSPSSESSESSA
ncbi:methyltransferase domain-containing protein [Streptomyces sp. RB6PN25]|uniref:Methyltransferase domain-containing protein n=1 Tax=Streptomyces humicola TaxID=2953240 RepID=A0ABT1PVQ0_9ACTN|nr:class I SAM-dependent methyltransferase [Streptomyces humicola]MCQ4081218.1 methyltransferase domain-containing protein [Streptomyces humicola]